VLLGTPLGNTLKIWGTTWEHGRNTSTIHGKKKLSPLSPAPKTQIKTLVRLSGCCTFPLAACKILFPKLLVTFLA